MDGLSLLAEARAAGLTVRVAGDKLVIRGPRRATSVAEKLLAHKADVMQSLAGNVGSIDNASEKEPSDGGDWSDARDEWGFPLAAGERAVEWPIGRLERKQDRLTNLS